MNPLTVVRSISHNRPFYDNPSPYIVGLPWILNNNNEHYIIIDIPASMNILYSLWCILIIKELLQFYGNVHRLQPNYSFNVILQYFYENLKTL